MKKVLFIILLSWTQAFAAGTESSGGGGHFLEYKFVSLARAYIDMLRNNHIVQAAKIKIPWSRLTEVVDNLRPLVVESVPPKNKKAKDIVYLDKKEWTGLFSGGNYRRRILNELMVLVDIPDDGMEVSGQLDFAISKMESEYYKPSDNKNLVSPYETNMILCEGDVAVACQRGKQIITYSGAVSILPSRSTYWGDCHGIRVICP